MLRKDRVVPAMCARAGGVEDEVDRGELRHGDVPALVRLAASGRTIMAIDGCPVACARKCLARHGVAPDVHFELGAFGVRKRLHADFDAAQAADMVERACAALAPEAEAGRR